MKNGWLVRGLLAGIILTSNPLTSVAQTTSTVIGPTIIQERCGTFTKPFFEWFSTITTGVPIGYGMQMCTWIDWPSNPLNRIVVPSGSLNVIIPVYYLGDAQVGEPTSQIPAYYPYGQSHAKFNITVTATDVTAQGVIPGANVPDPMNSDCGHSPLTAIPLATSTFTASISGNSMSVSSVANGPIALLTTVNGQGVMAGTQITGYDTGTGSTGGYFVNLSQNVMSETMTTGDMAQTPQNQSTGSITLYDSNAPDAPAGASQTSQQAPKSGLAYGQIVIPIQANWAQSILTFNISVSQGVPGNDPEYMGDEEQGPKCATDICPHQAFWTNEATFNTSNMPPSPAHSTLTCTGYPNCTCAQPEASEADVIPFAGLQLNYLPLAVIYSPIGSASLASYTVSEISGAQFQFGSLITTANAQTADDKEVVTGGVSGLLGLQFTSGWDFGIANAAGSQYGQVAAVANTKQINSEIDNKPPPGLPSVDKMTYDSEPFHNDIIVVAPNPQFFVWDYPDGYFAMPVGSEPYFYATIDELAVCANHLSAPTTPFTSLSDQSPTNPVTYNLSRSECAALLAVDPFAVNLTQNTLPSNFSKIAEIGMIRPYNGGKWSANMNTASTITSTTGSNYSTQLTATNSFAANATADPLTAFEKYIDVNSGLSKTSSTTNQSTFTASFTSMDSNTLQNGVTSFNQLNDPISPYNFGINIRVLQDPYFGTIAIQDENAPPHPNCLIGSGGVILYNACSLSNYNKHPYPYPYVPQTTFVPHPSLGAGEGTSFYNINPCIRNGTCIVPDVRIGTFALHPGLVAGKGTPFYNMNPCIRNGTCVRQPVIPKFTYATAYANVFRHRHFTRPQRTLPEPAHLAFPGRAQMLKYLQTSKFPASLLTRIHMAIVPPDAAK